MLKHAPRPLVPSLEALEPRRLLAAGDLDSSFAGDGVLTFAFDDQTLQRATAGAALAGGDLLVGGYGRPLGEGEQQDYLARLDPDGSFDDGFGNDGILSLGEGEGVTQVLPLPDGDALVVQDAGDGTTVRRINADGTNDGGLNGGAPLTIDLPRATLATLPGGGFVAVAATDDGASAPIRVYDPNGSLRGSNATADLVTLGNFDAFRPADVAVDGQGRIYVAGDVPRSDDPEDIAAGRGDPRAVVLRLDNDLSFDTTYGAAGEARVLFGNTEVFAATDLALDPLGRAALLVNEDDGANLVARFTDNGLPDRRVSGARFDVPGEFSTTNELVAALPLRDAGVLTAGFFEQIDDGGDVAGDAGLLLLSPDDLSPDATFGDGTLGPGQRRYDFGDMGDVTAAAFLTGPAASPFVVLVGEDFDANEDGPAPVSMAAVARVEVGPVADLTQPPEPDDFATLDDAGLLRVVGTNDDDRIFLSEDEAQGRAVVTLAAGLVAPRTLSFDFDEVTRVTVEVLGGDDAVTSGLLKPTTILGGGGDDTLAGGGADDVLNGGDGDDSLDGGEGNDLVLGTAGDDSLQGDLGDDTVNGGEGQDTLVMESVSDGADSLIGGPGGDLISYQNRSAAVRLSLDDAADDGESDIFGPGEGDFVSADIETVIGGAGDDLIVAAATTRLVEGRGGNDTFVDAEGVQRYVGGEGDDTLFAAEQADGPDDFDGGDGLDRLDYSARTAGVRVGNSGQNGADGEGDSFLNVEAFFGGSGDDVLTAPGGSMTSRVTLMGNAGNDRLTGGADGDSLVGGPGDDTLDGQGGGDELRGDFGDDTFLVGNESQSAGDTLVGDDGIDTADFTGRADGLLIVVGDEGDANGPTIRDDVEAFVGGGGDDTLDARDADFAVTLRGGGGSDSLLGSAFADALYGGDGDDSLDAGDGDDHLYGDAGDDRLIGGAGMDSLRGHEGADFLDGGDGNDRLVPGEPTVGANVSGGDTVNGGDGFDELDHRETRADLDIVSGNLAAENIEIVFGGSGNDRLQNFIRADGGAGDDTLRGTRFEPSALFGGPGDDDIGGVWRTGGNIIVDDSSDPNQYLDGGDGDDTLQGGNRDDTFAGGEGRDSFFDIGGRNTLVYAGLSEPVDVDLSRTDGDNGGDVWDDASFADVLGTGGDDTIRGSSAGNYLAGADGDDLIEGGDGKDVLVGGAGADTLDGGDDFDLLFATDEQTPNDGSADVLRGGGGRDVGLFESLEEDESDLVERFTADADELADIVD